MVQAYVLVQTEVGRAASVAAAVADLVGVITAEDVLGPYDVIVRCAGPTDAALATTVEGIQKIAGITRTLTCRLAS